MQSAHINIYVYAVHTIMPMYIHSHIHTGHTIGIDENTTTHAYRHVHQHKHTHTHAHIIAIMHSIHIADTYQHAYTDIDTLCLYLATYMPHIHAYIRT